MKKISIDIFGSCVSRDIFNYIDQQDFGLVLKHYFARSSIFSLYAKPLKYLEKDLQNESSFQKRMVVNDLSKKTIDLLQNDHSKYLLIDFVDERFNLLKIDSTYITYTNEFKNTFKGNMQNSKMIKREICNGNLIADNLSLSNYMSMFCNDIAKIFGGGGRT